MTLREKFEALQLSKGVGKEFLARGLFRDYRHSHIEDMWQGYQAGHAEGTKEAARRCAEIADLCADDGTHAVRRIRAEYPEAFTSDPPADRATPSP